MNLATRCLIAISMIWGAGLLGCSSDAASGADSSDTSSNASPATDNDGDDTASTDSSESDTANDTAQEAEAADVTCDTAEALTEALASASAGDIIELVAGSYTGSFAVPSGVTLRGNGEVTITSEGGAGIIVTSGSEVATTISGLTISGTEGAVVAMSTGDGQAAVDLSNLTIHAETGFGLALEGVQATLRDVTLHGPISSLDAPLLNTIGSSIDSRDAAVFGVVAHDSGLEIENMSLTGFAGFGAAFVNSTVAWSTGVVQYCIGTSIFAEASSVVLSGITITDATTGRAVSALNAISYGIAMTGDSDVISDGITIERVKGVGIFAHASTSSHDGISIYESRLNGIWVQDTTGTDSTPALSVSDALIEDNGSSALVVRDSFGLEIDNSDIRGTVLRPIISGLEIDNHGDGLQIIGTSGRIAMNTVTMHANERVGMLLDGGIAKTGGQAEYALSNVSVTTEEATGLYGLLTQHGAPARADLIGITVDDALAEADAVATNDGTVLTTIETNDTVPSSGSIINNGLIGTNGIIGTNGSMRTGGVSVTNGVVGAN